MFLVLVSDDAFSFLVSWEIMAVSSYFLVMFEDEKTQNRKASFLYLLIAHIGAVAILLSFGVMAGAASGFESFGGYTFDAMRSARLPLFWASVAFFLAFIGFGAKAGVVPLLAALALIAGLYHTLNHAVFKSLLFMGAGPSSMPSILVIGGIWKRWGD